MAIITLISDWGLKDYYVSAVKGAILSHCADAVIVDITHMLPAFNILQASFVLKNSYPNFPKGTVHIIGIDTFPENNSSPLAVYSNGHYFIGTDNGIFSLIFDNPPEKIVELAVDKKEEGYPFPARDLFVKPACYIARGGIITDLGKEKTSYVEKTLLRPVVNDSVIRGSVTYIDSYGNVITNISRSLFNEFGKGRAFTIFFRSFDYNIDTLSYSYNDVIEGEKLALFNSSDHLEIAINKGQAANLLNLRPNEVIRIEFYDRQNS